MRTSNPPRPLALRTRTANRSWRMPRRYPRSSASSAVARPRAARRRNCICPLKFAQPSQIARCSRKGSGDDRIREAAANPLIALLEGHPGIRRVAFNGGMAYRTARLLAPGMFGLRGVRYERMPSTSPRNARMPLGAKVEAWGRIKD